jgi:restriction system protein
MVKKSNAEVVRWYGPLLDALRDLGDSGKPREVSEKIAESLNLPDSILDETTPKLGLPKFHNQVA